MTNDDHIKWTHRHLDAVDAWDAFTAKPNNDRNSPEAIALHSTLLATWATVLRICGDNYNTASALRDRIARARRGEELPDVGF